MIAHGFGSRSQVERGPYGGRQDASGGGSSGGGLFAVAGDRGALGAGGGGAGAGLPDMFSDSAPASGAFAAAADSDGESQQQQPHVLDPSQYYYDEEEVGEHDPQMAAIREKLRKKKLKWKELLQVERLDFVNANLNTSNAKKLAKVLGDRWCLVRYVYLSWNNIGDKGAKSFARMLRTNATLVVLDLGSNNIGNKGAIALAKAIEANPVLSLRELHLDNNFVTDEGAAALLNAVSTNQTIAKLNLRSNNISVTLMAESEQIHMRDALQQLESKVEFFEGLNVGFGGDGKIEIKFDYFEPTEEEDERVNDVTELGGEDDSEPASAASASKPAVPPQEQPRQPPPPSKKPPVRRKPRPPPGPPPPNQPKAVPVEEVEEEHNGVQEEEEEPEEEEEVVEEEVDEEDEDEMEDDEDEMEDDDQDEEDASEESEESEAESDTDALVHLVRRLLGGNDILTKAFKAESVRFARGESDAHSYYSVVRRLFGSQRDTLVPTLLDALPDEMGAPKLELRRIHRDDVRLRTQPVPSKRPSRTSPVSRNSRAASHARSHSFTEGAEVPRSPSSDEASEPEQAAEPKPPANLPLKQRLLKALGGDAQAYRKSAVAGRKLVAGEIGPQVYVKWMLGACGYKAGCELFPELLAAVPGEELRDQVGMAFVEYSREWHINERKRIEAEEARVREAEEREASAKAAAMNRRKMVSEDVESTEWQRRQEVIRKQRQAAAKQRAERREQRLRAEKEARDAAEAKERQRLEAAQRQQAAEAQVRARMPPAPTFANAASISDDDESEWTSGSAHSNPHTPEPPTGRTGRPINPQAAPPLPPHAGVGANSASGMSRSMPSSRADFRVPPAQSGVAPPPINTEPNPPMPKFRSNVFAAANVRAQPKQPPVKAKPQPVKAKPQPDKPRPQPQPVKPQKPQTVRPTPRPRVPVQPQPVPVAQPRSPPQQRQAQPRVPVQPRPVPVPQPRSPPQQRQARQQPPAATASPPPLAERQKNRVEEARIAREREEQAEEERRVAASDANDRVFEWKLKYCDSAWLYKNTRKRHKLKAPVWKLLAHLDEILPTVEAGAFALTAESSRGQVKRAYHKALLVCHPDKLMSATMEHRVLASAVCAVIQEAYGQFSDQQ